MKHKRIPALLTAAACTAMMFSATPISPVSASSVVKNDFEVTYEGWHETNGGVSVTAVDGIGFNGSRGMLVENRLSAADGAQAEKYFYLEGGIKYNYSVRVFAETEETFRLTVTTVDADGNETVKEIDSKKVKAGKWATLSGTYKAPEGDGEFRIVVTTDTENDFRIDDVEITTNEDVTLTAGAADLGLKDEFANYFRVGNIFNGSTINISSIKQMMLKDHNAIECENETKPDATLVKNGSTDTNINVSLSRCAAICDFCAQNNLAFRGHTLVWHSQTPGWFFNQNFADNGSKVNASTMSQRMKSYITNMFKAYHTQYPTLNLYAYDVCNEVIEGSNGVRSNNPWVSVYGDNRFVKEAFQYAREASNTYAPGCKLFYNDYNEFDGNKKNLIKNQILIPLIAEGTLDGMGMQTHLNSAASNAWGDTKTYLAAMDDYLKLGIEVQVTEMDIAREGNTYSEAQQATKYKAIFQHAKEWNESHGPNDGRVTLVQVWGPCDGHSWVDTDSQGRQNYPLLYTSENSGLQPKAAYKAITEIVPTSEWGDGTKYAGSGVVIQDPEVDENGYWFHYTFENGIEGFSGRASETLTASSAQAYAGNQSLYVSNRGDEWNGPSVSLSARVFEPGETYSFSGCVMLAGSSSDTVHFTMSYSGSDGEVHYVKIKTLENVEPDQWVQLSNTSFQIPSDASSMQIYFETANTTANFYVDEVIGAPKGTTIAGPGAGVSTSKIRGDVTGDGKINGSDLSALKQGLLTGKYISAQGKRNADVNSNGKVDATDAQLLQQFLLAEIDEFPVEAAEVDWTQMEKAFNGVKAGTSLKKDNENNPLYTQRFGADPGWYVYNDRLYVFTTDDQFEYSGNTIKENSYNSGTINCISSADLVNWTDHGAIPAAGRNNRTTNGAARWASNAWAPDAAWKKINGKDKFFLYFANNGSGVGVLTSDSPIGPWTDPLGTELVSKSNTPNMNDVVWMFDPGVYYDEATDEGYLFMGGGVDGRDKANPKTGRCMKLNSDMISVDKNTVTTLENPYLFEDSSLIKIGNLWYYSYCANWNVPNNTNINGVSFANADILYMTSSNPLGPWTSSQLKGNVFKNTATQGLDKGGNNHHSIIYFKGEYYVLYHCRQLEMRMGVNGGNGQNYRSPQINKATYNSGNGTITCQGSMAGVSQIEKLNPYVENRAATMANNYGIQIKGVGNTTVTDIQAGDWVKVKGVDFSDGCHQLTVKASSSQGAVIKVTTGGADGTPFAYVEVPAGSSGSEITVSTQNIDGVNDITFEFSGPMEFETWKFS